MTVFMVLCLKVVLFVGYGLMHWEYGLIYESIVQSPLVMVLCKVGPYK